MTPPTAAMSHVSATPLLDLAEIRRRCHLVIERSPADETEIVWIETRRGAASVGAPAPNASVRPTFDREVLIRVEERGRVGTHRCGTGDVADLERAVREALAQARVHDKLPGLPHLPHDESPLSASVLHDRELAELDERSAREHLRARGLDHASLRWLEAHVAVMHRQGAPRSVAVTAATLSLGSAAVRASARSLSGLPVERLRAAVAERAAPAPLELSADDTATIPLLLEPSAAAALIGALARAVFSAHGYRTGASMLRDHLGHQVFDRCITLQDDPVSPEGMPFPFDLEGTAKHAMDLVRDGTLKTPALDQRHAALLGLTGTGHAAGGDDALPRHATLAPGDCDAEELLRRAAGGLAVANLGRVRWVDEKRLLVRAQLRGVRHLLPSGEVRATHDVQWEGNLLSALSRVIGLGRDSITVAEGPDEGLFGASRSPALVIPASGQLVALPAGAPS